MSRRHVIRDGAGPTPPSASSIAVCRAALRGVRCKKKVTDLMQHGVPVRSEFCSSHACRGQRDGETRLCIYPKDATEQVCKDHATCTMGIGVQRCRYPVRSNNPRKYLLCAELHSCKAIGCKESRISEWDEDMTYCTAHRCILPGCRTARAAGAPYCDAHTCTFEHCAAPAAAADGSPLGVGERFCERHRRCQADSCRRYSETKDDGTAAGFCAHHSCKWAQCEQQGLNGSYCRDHKCHERGCSKGLVSVDSLFCKAHECAGTGCMHAKGSLGDFCAEHKCARRLCGQAAVRGDHCGRHQLCRVVGCENHRFIDGEVVRDECEDHFHRKCRHPRCTSRVTDDHTFCQDHACPAQGCRSAQVNGWLYCGAHKCAIQGCGSLRRIAGLGGVSLPSQYCGAHTCEYVSCADAASAGTRFCRPHEQANTQPPPDRPWERTKPQNAQPRVRACRPVYNAVEGPAWGVPWPGMGMARRPGWVPDWAQDSRAYECVPGPFCGTYREVWGGCQ